MPQCGVNFLGDFFEKFSMVIPLDKIPVVHIQVLFYQQCIQFDPFGSRSGWKRSWENAATLKAEQALGCFSAQVRRVF